MGATSFEYVGFLGTVPAQTGLKGSTTQAAITTDILVRILSSPIYHFLALRLRRDYNGFLAGTLAAQGASLYNNLNRSDFFFSGHSLSVME